MRKFKKILIGGAFLLGLSASSLIMPNKVLATSVDITPPKGIVEIEGATLKDGVYYTSSTDVTLNIEVLDEVTASGDIKMIVSDGPISGEVAINDDNWEKYTPTKDWKLKNTSTENLIYLYLKDKANNISPNIIVDATANYTVTYSGEGENMPAAKTAQYGRLFNVSIQEPTLTDKYFLGWSMIPGGSVQWLSDSVIEASYIKGNITLYAVYADKAPLLADQVQIGEYVDYPVTYENVYTDGNGGKSAYTGWRVLDISGDEVTIVSAGTPLLFRHYTDSAASIEKITTNILDYSQYETCGINAFDLENKFNNEFTAGVTSMVKADIDKIVGETTSYNYALSGFGSLLHNNSRYWLASESSTSYLWRVGTDGSVSNRINASMGVRPKVYLVSGIRTTGRNISGVWQLEVP